MIFSIPLTAFIYCVTSSCVKYSFQSTRSHCNVWNFAPSISGKTGVIKYFHWSKYFLFSRHRKCFPQQRSLEEQHWCGHPTEAGDGLDVLDPLDGHHLQADLPEDHDQHGPGTSPKRAVLTAASVICGQWHKLDCAWNCLCDFCSFQYFVLYCPLPFV